MSNTNGANDDHPVRSDSAYGQIRHDLLTCCFMPGSTITESQLMDKYGIGKNSCRIALVRLIQEGLVRSLPRRGYRVAPITVQDVEEIFSLRAQLEPLAARMACGRIDTTLLRALDERCRFRDPALPVSEQIGTLLIANRAFHLAISEASGNARLHAFLANLADQMARLVALGFGVQGERPSLKHDHAAIIEAFEQHDADVAELITRRHIDTFRAMTMDKVHASLRSAGVTLPVFSIEDLHRSQAQIRPVR
jgi:DNA-binding GntR family transcriptional regulator